MSKSQVYTLQYNVASSRGTVAVSRCSLTKCMLSPVSVKCVGNTGKGKVHPVTGQEWPRGGVEV